MVIVKQQNSSANKIKKRLKVVFDGKTCLCTVSIQSISSAE
jgi:hypothetical protein